MPNDSSANVPSLDVENSTTPSSPNGDACSVSTLQSNAPVHAAGCSCFSEIAKACQDLGCSKSNIRVIRQVCRMLNTQGGGAFIVIIDTKASHAKLQTKPLDGDALFAVFKKECPNIMKASHYEHMKHVMDAFGAHSASDRWERANLEALASRLGYESLNSAPHIANLENKVMDGAHILSMSQGRVVAACRQVLPHLDSEEQRDLRKTDGETAGTRHSSALSTAIWLGRNEIKGAVIVRSDNGDRHVFVPGGRLGEPKVFAMELAAIEGAPDDARNLSNRQDEPGFHRSASQALLDMEEAQRPEHDFPHFPSVFRRSSISSVTEANTAENDRESCVSDLPERKISQTGLLQNIFGTGASIVDRISRVDYDRLRQRSKKYMKVSPTIEEEPGDESEPENLNPWGCMPLTCLGWCLGQYFPVERSDHEPQGEYDQDLDDVFAGTLPGTVPAIAVELRAPRYMIIVHVVGMVLFLARLLLLWRDHASLAEMAKCALMIAAFFVVGVVMPLHAQSLHFSRAVRRVLTIQQAYRYIQPSGLRLFIVAKHYRFIQAFSVLVAIVPSLCSFFQAFTANLDAKGGYETHSLSLIILTGGALWLGFNASIGVAAVDMVCIDACEICVEGLASHLKGHEEICDEGENAMKEKIDWASIHRKCIKLHQVLDEVWDFPSVGGFFLFRVLLLYSGCVFTGAISLHPDVLWKRVLYKVSAAIMALSGSYMLLRLARISLRCSDQRPNTESLFELTLRCGGRVRGDRAGEGDRNMIQYHTFLNYLNMSYIGIQIAGIPITFRLVIIILLNLVGTFQLALLYTGQMLYPESESI